MQELPQVYFLIHNCPKLAAPKCPSTGEWINKPAHLCNGNYSVIKTNDSPTTRGHVRI